VKIDARRVRQNARSRARARRHKRSHFAYYCLIRPRSKSNYVRHEYIAPLVSTLGLVSRGPKVERSLREPKIDGASAN